MKKTSVLASTIVIALIATSILSLWLPNQVQAAIAPTVTKYSIPVGSNPISLTSDGNFLYYGSNANGSVYKVNASDGSYTKLGGITGAHNWESMYFYRKAIWMVDSSTNGGGIYSYNLTTLTFGLVNLDGQVNNIGSSRGQMMVAGQCPVGKMNFTTGNCGTWDKTTKTFTPHPVQNFWYSAYGQNFLKMEYLKDAASGNPDAYYYFPYNCSSNPVLCDGGGVYQGFAQDRYGDVLFTDVNNGWLFIYNATQNQMYHYGGFTRPLGIAVVGYDAYIAQNVADGGIVKFNLKTLTISETFPTIGSTPFAVTVVNGVIVWDSNGPDQKICALSGPCVVTGEQNFYLLPGGGDKVYFGYLGSSGIGEVEGLTTTPPPTTTTISPSSTTSSDTSTSSSSTATSSATTTSDAPPPPPPPGDGGGGGGPSSQIFFTCSAFEAEVGDPVPCQVSVKDLSFPVEGNITFSSGGRGTFDPGRCQLPFTIGKAVACSTTYTPALEGMAILAASYTSKQGSQPNSGVISLRGLTPTILTITVTMTTNATQTINSTVTQTTTSTQTVNSIQTYIETSTTTATETVKSTQIENATVTQTRMESTTETLTSTHLETSTVITTSTETVEAPIKVDGSMILPTIIIGAVTASAAIGVKVLQHRRR